MGTAVNYSMPTSMTAQNCTGNAAFTKTIYTGQLFSSLSANLDALCGGTVKDVTLPNKPYAQMTVTANGSAFKATQDFLTTLKCVNK